MFNVAIVAFPNCHASGVHGIMDFFTVANFCGRAPAGRSEPLFNCQVVTVDDQPVRGYSGAVVTPTCKRGDFEPDLIVVACGFDAAAIDPLARMLATTETFRAMTMRIKDMANTLCDGRLVLVHEGGYSEVYVPFCGYATLEALSGSKITAPDPFAEGFASRQPGPRFDAFLLEVVDEMAQELRPG